MLEIEGNTSTTPVVLVVVACIAMEQLASTLRTIPQSAVLFAGSVVLTRAASRLLGGASARSSSSRAGSRSGLDAVRLLAENAAPSEIREFWKKREGEHGWLEAIDSDEALDWVRENNDSCFKALGTPQESSSYSTILSILESKDKIPHIGLVGELYYNYWTDAQNVRGILRRTTLLSYKTSNPKWETVIDIDKLCADEKESWVYKGYQVYKPDPATDKQAAPSRILLKLSRGGADATVVREFDLQSKQFVLPVDGGFALPEAKSFVSWKDADTLFVGTDMHDGVSMTDAGYPRTVREWKRGTALADSKLIMECESTDMLISGFMSRHKGHKYQMVQIMPTFYTNTLMLKMSMGSWVEVPKPDHATVDQFADKLLITLRKDWALENGKGTVYKAGSLLSVELSSLLKDRDHANLTVLFEPTERCSMDGLVITNKFVVISLLENVRSKLVYWKHSKDHGWVKKHEESPASIRGISIGSVDDDSNDFLWVTRYSFVQPSSLSLVNASDGQAGMQKAKGLKCLPAMFDSSNLEEEQFEAKSADGTMIPYFIVHKKGAVQDGNTPTLIYGYGGFEISMTPGYAAVVGKQWLEKGGIYVVANIRGGGEFGPQWHQAALKENRNKCYEDFIAIGEDLIARNVTSPKRLGIRGGSNGGLLMGNMYTMRPDLWGAVVCQVPLLDMYRYSHLLAGASWMAEYGNPDEAEDWAYLQQYSAYHNIDTTKEYPPLLMTSSTRDDRVHPYHARAFYKRMQDVQAAQVAAGMKRNELYYYENIEGGHGGAADSKQQAAQQALVYDFLWKMLQR